MHTSVTSNDLRSRSRSRSFRSCEKCTFLCLSPPPFLRGAQKWWLAVIVWELDYSLSEPDFWISFRESYHASSHFALCPYFTIFQWPYFGSAWRYSHMVGRATSSTRSVYIDVTLTRSKVKVTVLLNFRQFAKPCMLAAMTAAPLRGFLVEFPSRKAITRVQTSSNVDISRNSNGHISVLRDRWAGW